MLKTPALGATHPVYHCVECNYISMYGNNCKCNQNKIPEYNTISTQSITTPTLNSHFPLSHFREYSTVQDGWDVKVSIFYIRQDNANIVKHTIIYIEHTCFSYLIIFNFYVVPGLLEKGPVVSCLEKGIFFNPKSPPAMVTIVLSSPWNSHWYICTSSQRRMKRSGSTRHSIASWKTTLLHWVGNSQKWKRVQGCLKTSSGSSTHTGCLVFII